MKKSLLNIKNFVDSNVRQRIDRATNSNIDIFNEDVVKVERQFKVLRQICIDTEKRISCMLQSVQKKLKELYLNHEQKIETQCLSIIQQVLENDIPNVIKLRKLFIKSHNELESVRVKYNGASQKQLLSQQQQMAQASQSSTTSYTITQSSAQQANSSKLNQLKKELDDSISKCDQARDTYIAELYAFVCRECELVNLFQQFYRYQAEYHQQVGQVIDNLLPTLSNTLVKTRRRAIFGSPLDEHLRCTGRAISPVIELSIHLLHLNGLTEEGLFRIPGSSVKIKKLKNAINVWFVTLASEKELDIESQPPTSSSCLLAIYSLYKEILGQPVEWPSLQDNNEQITTIDAQQQQQQQSLASVLQTTTLSGGGSANSIATCSESCSSTLTNSGHQFAHHAGSSSSSSYSNQPTAQQNSNRNLIYDLHSIAGLLKLYLRELPEHLLTYALYDNWIEATVRSSDLDERLALYENLLKQLPRSNYENLRHLIRFLHKLTCHRDLNKMTATNLAITMAPSLIWAKPVVPEQQQQNTISGADHQQSLNQEQQQHHDESNSVASQQVAGAGSNSLSMQMSSVGMSASLHALVIETLISQAERLFPGQIQLTLAGFAEQETPISGGVGGGSSSSNNNKSRLADHLESNHQYGNSNNSRSSSSIGHFKRDSPSLSTTSSSRRGFGTGDACGGNDIRSGTKSNSPTGLSTASSSSFSSTSNASASSGNGHKSIVSGGGYGLGISNNSADVASSSSADHLQRRTAYSHDRRGGSMEGLLSQDDIAKTMAPIEQQQHPSTPTGNHRVTLTRGRPVSVHIPAATVPLVGGSQAPLVPPAPISRRPLSSVKPPAPPLPPLSQVRRNQLTLKQSTIELPDDQPDITNDTATVPRAPGRGLRASELRSSISSAGASAKRPTVPPPERPQPTKSLLSQERVDTIAATSATSTTSRQPVEHDSDSKSGHSITSSGHLRGDFEETNSNGAEEEEVSVSVSPVASLDSISDDDSSFNGDEVESPLSPVTRPLDDDDGHDHDLGSWTGRCMALNKNTQQNPGSTAMTRASKNVTATTNKPMISNKPNVIENSVRPSASSHQDTIAKEDKEKEATPKVMTNDELGVPVKPPRIMSPKLTHSTPL